MAVGGISQFVNPIMDSFMSNKGDSCDNKDPISIRVLAIGDAGCKKDDLLQYCAYDASRLNSGDRKLLKRTRYNIHTQCYNVKCQLQLLDTSCETIYNNLRYKAYCTVDCVVLCYSLIDGHSFSKLCDSWIAEVRHTSRSVPIVSVRIIDESQDDEDELEMDKHWKRSMEKGCKFHLDCHLNRNVEINTFLNMVSVASLHKQGYTFLDGKVIKRRHNEIKNFFGLSSSLCIPLPIPVIKQKELLYKSLHYENNFADFTSVMNDESLSDVVFVCGSDYYYCHRVILCSRVALFRELFGVLLDCVECTDKVMFNKELLLTTNLFDKTSISQLETASDKKLQIKINEDISSVVLDILIKCIYKSTLIIDDRHDHYNTIMSYIDNLGISLRGQTDLWSCERYLRTIYESKVFSDLTLIVDDERFAVHKTILCARSSMFSAMFSGRYKEGSQSEISLPTCSSSHFVMFLDWIYFGRSDTADSMVTGGLTGETLEPLLSLLKLGDQFCIDGLRCYAEAKISELLSRHLCRENLEEIPGLLTMCETFNSDKLRMWIVQVIAGYFYEPYTTPAVKQCFTGQQQQDIEELKPKHLSLVKKLKSYYFTT